VSKIYRPAPTIAKFLLCRKKEQFLLGPLGGGKTTAVLMKILALSQMQAPNTVGVRRTRFAVVRNTRPQLRDSVLKTVFDWLPPDGNMIEWRETEMNLTIRMNLPDDTRSECELMFRPLDDENDARRLLSVEYTGAWLSEFREIPFALLNPVLSRTSRFPSDSDGGPTWHGVLGESNMPTRGSEWHRFLEVERPDFVERFIQPSGLSPTAENRDHLSDPDYYTDLVAGAPSQNWVKAHITCEYPDSLDGKAVHGATYDFDRHVAKAPFSPFPSGTILMGVDQGRSPAAVFAQVHPSGQLFVVAEACGSNMGMEKFGADILRPLVNKLFIGLPILAVIDPAGFRKTEVNDDTPADALKRLGFRVIKAPTNALDRRLEAVDRMLLKHNGLLINPTCTLLINALAADYRFRTKKNGELEDIPEKKHPVSDLCDSLQYLCLIAAGENYGRVMRRFTPGVTASAPPSGGWT
jgi:hypothetical protein